MESTYASNEYVCAEMMNGKWARKGNYKDEKVAPSYRPDKWILYDLSIGPGETTDILAKPVDLLENMIQAWEQYAENVRVSFMVQ